MQFHFDFICPRLMSVLNTITQSIFQKKRERRNLIHFQLFTSKVIKWLDQTHELRYLTFQSEFCIIFMYRIENILSIGTQLTESKVSFSFYVFNCLTSGHRGSIIYFSCVSISKFLYIYIYIFFFIYVCQIWYQALHASFWLKWSYNAYEPHYLHRFKS